MLPLRWLLNCTTACEAYTRPNHKHLRERSHYHNRNNSGDVSFYNEPRVPHISPSFGEMWELANAGARVPIAPRIFGAEQWTTDTLTAHGSA
jgi:hypothetical protein